MSPMPSLPADPRRRALMLALLPAAAGAAPAPSGPAAYPVLRQPAPPAARAAAATLLALGWAGPRLVAVGERGLILTSDDQGHRWTQARSPVRSTLTAVQFVDAQQGWAVGHLGVILHSRDGGLSWVKQLDGLQLPELYARAAQGLGAQAQAQAAQLAADGPDKPWLALSFQDARRGLVVGAYNLALATEDGGAHWQPLSAHLPNPRSLHLYGLARQGETVLLAGEQGLLLRSEDGGQHFAPLASPYRGSWFGVQALREGEFLLHGLRGTVQVSHDRGSHWQPLDTGLGVSITAGAERADGGLLLASQAGELLHRAPGATTLQRWPTPPLPPLAALAALPGGGAVVAGLRGVLRVDPPAR